VVPSDRQVDLKRLGHALGEKRLRIATQREAERLTA
jgi:prolyl-tRNA editing enzyme YbaK/EbsC (Cys-tRNA(Pro) deacylase)